MPFLFIHSKVQYISMVLPRSILGTFSIPLLWRCSLPVDIIVVPLPLHSFLITMWPDPFRLIHLMIDTGIQIHCDSLFSPLSWLHWSCSLSLWQVTVVTLMILLFSTISFIPLLLITVIVWWRKRLSIWPFVTWYLRLEMTSAVGRWYKSYITFWPCTSIDVMFKWWLRRWPSRWWLTFEGVFRTFGGDSDSGNSHSDLLRFIPHSFTFFDVCYGDCSLSRLSVTYSSLECSLTCSWCLNF